MDIFWITETQLIPFLLIFIRVSGILFAAPMFGERAIPVQVRICLGLLLALILVPVVQKDRWPSFSETPQPIVLVSLALIELMVGLILGFISRLFFDAAQLAGHLAGYQMGLAMANIIDPMSAAHVSLPGQLQTLVAGLIFLNLNAHHLLIRALVKSFGLIPPTRFQLQGVLVERVMVLAGRMFILAIQIAAPVIAVSLFVNLFLALMARTIPQINVFIVAMPLGIAIGLFILAMSMPLVVQVLGQAFHDLDKTLLFLMRRM
ncbi:MAG: flagellar biosynthetic protein FliR [bacterium]|nr:flagellar biosynthetic protein FliR [bacterium]